MSGEAGRRWRILLVEDCVDDAELVTFALRDAHVDADVACVDSEDALLAELARAAPDLVLSDLNLPCFSGVQAHAIVRERAPRARFAFMLGGDEVPSLPPADAVLSKNRLPHLAEAARGLLEMGPRIPNQP